MNINKFIVTGFGIFIGIIIMLFAYLPTNIYYKNQINSEGDTRMTIIKCSYFLGCKYVYPTGYGMCIDDYVRVFPEGDCVKKSSIRIGHIFYSESKQDK